MRHGLWLFLWALFWCSASAAAAPAYDLIIRGGTLYDGSGGAGVAGDIAVRVGRIAAIGPHLPGSAPVEIDARDRAVSPGFINMLAHPEESFLIDGRGLSDLKQGVTLEVLGEDSMGPLSPAMKAEMLREEGDLKYPVDWTTLGQYLDRLVSHGVSLNVASYVGEATVRANLFGATSAQPTPDDLNRMKGLVRQAMEEGALGLTTALIYTPATFARTDEIKALASEAARCGGLYAAHIRNEGDRVEEAVAESIDIARSAGGAAEIYHLKQSGRDNWAKLDAVVALIEKARAEGVPVTADIYPYPRSATGLDAAMPPWVQDGGLEAWITRLKDPAVRARLVREMREAHPKDWENTYMAAGGAEGVLLLGFKDPALKPYSGMTLAQVAHLRGTGPEETIMDLVIEDDSRIEVSYASMNEANIRREIALPWVSYDSDAAALAPEGVFLKSSVHPRAYGAFARVLGRYVREDGLITLGEAVRKLTALPADVLELRDRGRLKVGYWADIVVLDPATILDRATFEKPHQLALGVDEVVVNGVLALHQGEATAARPGEVVRGRAWIGWPDGGCRAAAADWSWAIN